MGIALGKRAIDLGIVTTNGDAMLAFYRDLLGLDYKGSQPTANGKGTMHRLLCGDTLIKLVVVPEVPSQAPKGDIQAANGYRYWTMTVTNLSEMMQACVAAQTPVVTPETELRPKLRIAIVNDPDGNLVEFLQLG